MREHLVAECETRYLLADRGDYTCRFDAERQRWLSAHVPVAYADDLVPVADPCGAHRDHQLVRRGRSRCRELEHAHVGAERIDAGGSHPTHDRHVPGILEFDESRSPTSYSAATAATRSFPGTAPAAIASGGVPPSTPPSSPTRHAPTTSPATSTASSDRRSDASSACSECRV